MQDAERSRLPPKMSSASRRTAGTEERSAALSGAQAHVGTCASTSVALLRVGRVARQ